MDSKRIGAAVRGLALGFDSSAGVVVEPLSLPHSRTSCERLRSHFARSIAGLALNVPLRRSIRRA